MSNDSVRREWTDADARWDRFIFIVVWTAILAIYAFAVAGPWAAVLDAELDREVAEIREEAR